MNSRSLSAGNQVDGPGPTGRIGVRAQKAARLVQQEVARRLLADGPAVDRDVLPARIDARAQIAFDLAVDADATRDNVFLTMPAGAKPRRREEPLQSNAVRLAFRSRALSPRRIRMS